MSKNNEYDEKFNIIPCPVCGREYLPEEILYPDSVLGKHYEIFKDHSGKVSYAFGTPSSDEETFICEDCLSKFRVKIHLSFDTEIIEKDEDEYVTKIKKKDKDEVELFDKDTTETE